MPIPSAIAVHSRRSTRIGRVSCFAELTLLHTWTGDTVVAGCSYCLTICRTTMSSSLQLTFTNLHSSDRLLSSPHHHPLPQHRAPSSPAPLPSSTQLVFHSCSAPSCSQLTTSPVLPAAFLPLATLCFPPAAGAESTFSVKSLNYLCRTHRATLQHFRQRVVTHASDSAQLWTDDLHSSPVKAGEAERDEEDESKREPTAESALVGRSAAPLRYSTFADTVALDASEVEGEKRPLSLAARGALAGGWLLVVAFVALTGAWGVVAQLRS